LKLLIAATLLAASLGAALTPAAAVTTIAANRAGTVDSRVQFYWGQTFTTASTIGGAGWETITFNFYDRFNAPIAVGTGYLFAAPYSGTPGGLASAGAIASAAGNGVIYRFFTPGLRLAAATRYYFYADGAMRLRGGAIAPGGEGFVFSQQPTNIFSALQPQSADFTVTGTRATVPEPASWALMIAGFGMVGTSLRRRKAVATA